MATISTPNLARTFGEEEASERCPSLARKAHSMATRLAGWGWTNLSITYKYGKPGTGSAHLWLTAERGDHGLTLEYLYRLNTRTQPSITFLGGFWDGGPFRNETDLTELAKPLRSAYNQPRKSNQGRGTTTMATTATPRKRAAKTRTTTTAAESTPTPPRKRAAKKAAPAPPVESEETPKKGRRRGRGPWENLQAQRAEVVNLRDNQGLGWAEIAEKVGVTAGMATFIWYSAQYGSEFHGQASPEVVAEERDVNNMSWSELEAKYWITRGEAWDLYAEAGGDHFKSDIGKGGRYIERDPEVVAERQAARKSAGGGRRKKFKGFTDDTPEDDIVNMIDGRRITWNGARGELSATAKPDSIGDFKTDAKGRRSFPFSDGSKSRTVFVNAITAVG